MDAGTIKLLARSQSALDKSREFQRAASEASRYFAKICRQNAALNKHVYEELEKIKKRQTAAGAIN